EILNLSRATDLTERRSRLHVDNHHQSTTSLAVNIVVLRMMGNMAMKQPLAGSAGSPNHIEPLTWSNIHRVREVSRTGAQRLAIDRDDLEGTAMDVHGVDEVVAAA